jgi:hypothetical protein
MDSGYPRRARSKWLRRPHSSKIVDLAAEWDSFHLAKDEYDARAVVQKARELKGVLAEADEREKARQEQAAQERRAFCWRPETIGASELPFWACRWRLTALSHEIETRGRHVDLGQLRARRDDRRPNRSTKCIRPMIERSSAAS